MVRILLTSGAISATPEHSFSVQRRIEFGLDQQKVKKDIPFC